MRSSNKKPPYLRKKRKFKRGEAHTHPSITDFDKEIPKYPTFHDNCHTTTANFYHSVKKFPDRPCMSFRPVKEIKMEEVVVGGVKKMWNIIHYDKTVTFSYQTVWNMSVHTGDGLQSLCGLKKGDRVCIFEDTRYEWFLIAQGAWRNGFVITTAYANLGIENLVYCLNKTKSSVMFLNSKNVPLLMKHGDQLPHLKYLFYLDELSDSVKKEVDAQKRFTIQPFPFLLNHGEKNAIEEDKLAKCEPEDYVVLMFTSGTTGVPKAVQIRHSNFCAGMFSSKLQLGFDEKTVYLSYLPLAHILELEAENCVLAAGGHLCFANNRTLVRGCKPQGDVAEFKPTVMIGVPRVFDTIKKGVKDQVVKKGGLANIVFKAGYLRKRTYLRRGQTEGWFWNWLVFDDMKKKFGGRLQMLASGAAPLSKSSHEFMASIFDCPFVQGYGLTEVCGACTGQDLSEFTTDNVGYPITTCLIKLVSVGEMGYNVTDQPCERGEICVSGPTVSGGYFEMPEKTREDFKKHEDDGRIWFHTGDIGLWRKDGQLSIIDRKKNIIKLCMGEYVAVLSLEAKYMADSPFIAPNGIFVHADPTKDRLIAVCQPQVPYLMRWAKENGKKEQTIEQLCQDKDVNKAVMDDLAGVAKKNNYKKFQYITACELVTDEWTSENGLMTATFKLRRKEMTERYKDLLEILFHRAGAEVDHKLVKKLMKKRKEEMKRKKVVGKKKEEEEEEVEGEDD